MPNSLQKQKKKKSKNQDKQINGHSQQPQAQQADTGAHAAPPQGNRNKQRPPPGQNQYFYPPPPGGYMYLSPPPPQQHIPQPNQIIIQQDPNAAAALQQMAQLHQQHFEMSQNQTKALKNITSTFSFTSMVSCIQIYDGKDKDACTEWR